LSAVSVADAAAAGASCSASAGGGAASDARLATAVLPIATPIFGIATADLASHTKHRDAMKEHRNMCVT